MCSIRLAQWIVKEKEAGSSIQSEKEWKQLFIRFTLYLHKEYQCKSSQWKIFFASLSKIASCFQR